MMENKYKELLRPRVKSAIEQALAVKKNIDHPGVKGKIVEILVKDLFLPLLPSDIGVGTGQIIESYKNLCSTEHDVILYDKSILPPVLFDGTTGLFPIESVLYTIEVKTTLTAQELKKSHEAAKKLREFRFLPGLKDQNGKEVHGIVAHPVSVIFGLSSDLTEGGKSEAERYKEIYGDEGPFIAAICVAGKEYWHEKSGSWFYHENPKEYDEVLSFIGGLMNTYKKVAESRGKPSLGYYVIDVPSNNLVTIPSGTEPVIKVVCNACGNLAVLNFGKNKIDLNSKDGFKSKDPCCKCGNELVAPPGKYEIKDSELIRIGDCDE